MEYNALGQKESETVLVSFAGNVTQTTDYGYDARGRLVTVTQPAVFDSVAEATVRPLTEYGYDAYGNRTTITDANGRVTEFHFDAYGRQTGRTLPEVDSVLASESTAYDKYGRVDYAVDFNGTVVDTVYDDESGSGLDTKLGRVARVEWTRDGETEPEEVVEYEYDDFGRVTVVTETKGLTVRETETGYDDEGRVLEVTSPEGVIGYAYDEVTGRRMKMVTADTEVRYGYDAWGRLETVTEWTRGGVDLTDPVVTAYAFDAVGNVESVTVTSDEDTPRETTNSYDPVRHWLVGIANEANGEVVSAFGYTRRADGQIVGVAEGVTQADVGVTVIESTTAYTYDALNRLVLEEYVGDDESRTTAYTLDLVGNRLAKSVTVGAGSPVVTEFACDANGS